MDKNETNIMLFNKYLSIKLCIILCNRSRYLTVIKTAEETARQCSLMYYYTQIEAIIFLIINILYIKVFMVPFSRSWDLSIRKLEYKVEITYKTLHMLGWTAACEHALSCWKTSQQMPWRKERSRAVALYEWTCCYWDYPQFVPN